MKIRTHLNCLLLSAVIGAAGQSAIADEIWKGSTSSQWNVGANWSGNTVPGAGEAAVFNNLSTANRNTVLGQDFSIGSIVLSNVPGVVAIGGANTLTLTPPVLTTNLPIGINMSNAAQALSITAPVSLGNTQVWAVATGQGLDVSGPISGVGGIYKDAPGTLTLEGTNTFSGNFTNNGGPVWINNSGGLGTGPKTVYICNNLVGAGLHLNATNGSITLPNNLNFLVSQNLGAIFNEAGDNVINGALNVFSGGGLAYIVANAGTLTLNGNVGLATSPRPFQVGGAGNGIINGFINGSGFPFAKTDSGTWTLTAHNGYSGPTLIQGGKLILSTNATIASTPSITLSSNAVLDASVVSNTLYEVNAFYLDPSGAVPQTLAGSGSVLGNVLAGGAAYLVPGDTNGIGTLSFSNNLSLGYMTCFFDLNTATTPGAGVNDLINVTGNLDPGSSTIFVTALTPLTSPGTYRLFNYQGTNLNSFAGVSVQTDTRYTLNVDDSTNKQVNLTVGGAAGNLVWSGGGGASWDLIYNANPNWNNNGDYFYNADSTTFDDSSPYNTVSITGPVRPASVLVTNNSAGYVFGSFAPGKITGLTGLKKAGTGGFTNTAASCDFTGPVVVSGGSMTVYSVANGGSASPLGAGTNITLDGGTFQFGGPRPGAGTFNRSWTLGPGGGTVLSLTNTFFIAGQISGPGSLTKTGSQQLILGDITTGVLSTGASNAYFGNTYVTQGELQLRNNHALGFGKAVVSTGADIAFGGGVNYGTITNNIDLNGGDGNGNGGTLQVNDANTQVTYGGTINLLSSSSIGSLDKGAITFNISGPIIGSGALKKLSTNTITLTCTSNSYSGGTTISNGFLQLGNGGPAGTLGSGPVANYANLIFNHSDSTTNSAAISGSGTLTKKGAGTLTLNGACTYSNATTVSGGTLAVNGSLGASPVTVASGGTLGGYGTINGSVTFNSGSTLALGSSIGTLTISNIVNLAGTNIMKVSHGTTATNDSIRGVSTLTFGGALNITLIGTLQAGDTFHLFNATTYAASAFSSTNLPALGGNLAWDTSGLTNGTLKVYSTAVPQPVFNPPFHRPDGNIQLTFSGQSGSSYRLWATTNISLTPITSTWSNLSSGTFSGAPVAYTDLFATNYTRRFYTISIP